MKLTETIYLSERPDGWWLYDATRGMNLSMRAASAQAAFVESITYYQKRLAKVEDEHRRLTAKVDAFVCQLDLESDDHY